MRSASCVAERHDCRGWLRSNKVRHKCTCACHKLCRCADPVEGRYDCLKCGRELRPARPANKINEAGAPSTLQLSFDLASETDRH